MKRALLVNHVLISAFGLMSGMYKTFGGEADLKVFAHLGMTPWMVAVFGVVQAAAGGLTWLPQARTPAAVVLALCNTLATVGLFAAGVVPFGVVSILFIAMAVLVTRR